MWKLFYQFLCFIDYHYRSGNVVALSMSETYSSINIAIDGEKYLLTIMKEEKKDDSV